MAENPTPDTNPQDPSTTWPEEVKQAYAHLKVPSLYDALLANEKMSLEIRRQDRELKTVSDGVQTLISQLALLLKIAEEEWEEYDDEEEDDETTGEEGASERVTHLEAEFLGSRHSYFNQRVPQILIETNDALLDLSYSTKQMVHQLLTLLPKKVGLLPRLPEWYPPAEELVQRFVDKIEKVRYHLLTRLQEIHIEVINPQPGETFNDSFHHALEYVTGGTPGTIAQVIQVGYLFTTHVMRPAEVSVFN